MLNPLNWIRWILLSGLVYGINTETGIFTTIFAAIVLISWEANYLLHRMIKKRLDK